MEAEAEASAHPTEGPGTDPTAAQVDDDRTLALQTAWASLAGYAVWIHPAAGAAITAATPIFEKIATFAVKKLGGRRIEHAAETLLDAAAAADEPLAEFIDKAVADDRRHELFARTMTIAQDTALRNKRRALGQALAAGVMGGDEQINEELLFIRAINDVDEMHIRLLDHMATTRGSSSQWSARTIEGRYPGLGHGVLALLGTLELHGLIAAHMRSTSATLPGISPATPGSPAAGPVSQRPFYDITESGRRLLKRLADEDLALGPSVPSLPRESQEYDGD